MRGKNLTTRRGSELSYAKLNEKLVARIRHQYERKQRLKKMLDAKYSIQALAARYGVHKFTILKVVTYETWRHVK